MAEMKLYSIRVVDRRNYTWNYVHRKIMKSKGTWDIVYTVIEIEFVKKPKMKYYRLSHIIQVKELYLLYRFIDKIIIKY